MIHPVILSGGSGTRLWPMSRDSHPKQFLPLLDGRSTFRATLERLRGLEHARAPIVVARYEHRFLVEQELRAARVQPGAVYGEPFGRNTAPPVAIVALDLVREDPDALMLILPADHDIPDEKAFCRAVGVGVPAAREGRLVVFGVSARWAEPGYGYVERGEPLAGCDGCYRVSRFIEKPEQEVARRLIASRECYWNSGILLCRARCFLRELNRLQPDLASACRSAAASIVESRGCRRIGEHAFARCRPASLDHAVLEATSAAAVVPASFRWSDIGSWNALWDSAEKDARGNVCAGDVSLHETSNCYVASTQRIVVGIGLKDAIVVETPDAVLVADRNEAQRVREAVEQMRLKGRPECQAHRRVHRPWGWYEDVDAGERFRVKRIRVDPGGKLSLQLHHHRAEHWVVVSGAARVTRGDETMLLVENQGTYIPLGVRHRIENPGIVPLEIIEVQSGGYLGEDDIVRLEDAYDRV